MNTTDCDEVLAHFIESIPLTQRDWLAARVHLIVLDGGLDRNAKHLEDLLGVLRESDDLERPHWVVKIAAALDHALLRYGAPHKEALEYAAGKLRADGSEPSAHVDAMLARADLREKHLTLIRGQWTKLRATSLSPVAVREFENTMHGIGRGQS